MKLAVLDEGYVEFIEAWGGGRTQRYNSQPDQFEVGIVEAARQSTQGSFRGWEVDKKLLATLFNSRPQHATPFEFAGCVIEVQAPIMVFREWHRHRVQSYNEMSARYAPLPDLYYVPDYSQTLYRCEVANKTKNKQQQSLGLKLPVIPADVETWLENGRTLQVAAENHYQQGLKIGIPKELARYNMPVCHYSRMRASANLRNWLAFMTLRDQPGVMWETREYAAHVGAILEATFPHTWELFDARRHLEDEIQKLIEERQS